MELLAGGCALSVWLAGCEGQCHCALVGLVSISRQAPGRQARMRGNVDALERTRDQPTPAHATMRGVVHHVGSAAGRAGLGERGSQRRWAVCTRQRSTQAGVFLHVQVTGGLGGLRAVGHGRMQVSELDGERGLGTDLPSDLA